MKFAGGLLLVSGSARMVSEVVVRTCGMPNKKDAARIGLRPVE